MTAIAALGLVRAGRLVRAADVACAMSLEALQGSRTSFHAATLPARCGDSRRAPNGFVRCSKGRRSSNRIGGATRCRTPTRSAVHRRSTGRAVTSGLRVRDRRHRAERGDRQPTRAGRRRAHRLERQLPRAADRVRARCARDGGGRACEHLGASGRTSREPVAVRRSAAVPRALRRRAQLWLHDPSVRRRVARLREQGAGASRLCGLDPDECRAGGSRVDGQHLGSEGVAGARQRRAGARDRALAGAQGVEFLAPLEPGRGVAAARAFVRTLSARVREDRSRRRTSSSSRRRSATAGSTTRLRTSPGRLHDGGPQARGSDAVAGPHRDADSRASIPRHGDPARRACHCDRRPCPRHRHQPRHRSCRGAALLRRGDGLEPWRFSHRIRRE